LGARDRIRDFFEKNVGKIVKTQEIRKVAGISEYARRIRELRNEEGMQIITHIDRHDLRPGEYVLETLKRKPVIGRGVSRQMRNEIMERNGYMCQLCGAGAGDPDPFNPNRKLRLHVDHIVPASQGGANDEDNLRVLCSACNEGRSNIQGPTETARNLLIRIRRNRRSVQREVYEALKKTFGDG